MPRPLANEDQTAALRVRPEEKATIARAADLARMDMSSFILRAALREAERVIREHERIKLSGRDSQLVMKMLENPPAANARLRKAARALKKQ